MSRESLTVQPETRSGGQTRGEQCGASRGFLSRHRVGAFQYGPLRRQSVEIGCLRHGIAVATQSIRPHLTGEDQKEVKCFL